MNAAQGGRRVDEAAPVHDPLARLEKSREQILATARAHRLDPGALRRLADVAARTALAVDPMPIDPVAHLRAAHAQARPSLLRLARHDPTQSVVVNQEGYSYTPRKVLRRVLDHALDHLHQIDQWLVWQRDGVAPVPADGWAGSTVTLDEDRAPLSAPELAAWLWRIDLAVELVVHRAGTLTPARLDWAPPDGGWTLREVLHHLAASETFYAVSLDGALPEDATERYAEASRRLLERLRRVATAPLPPGTAFFGGEIDRFTPEQVAAAALAAEQAALAE